MRKLLLAVLLLGSAAFAQSNGDVVQGPGSAGSPKGGVSSVQGVTSGTPVPVTLPAGGSATQVQGTAANGAATVGNPVWICGLNGSNCVALLVDSSGRLILGAGTQVIGHVIADTGSTTAVTGNVTAVQPTGTNLHVVIDSGAITNTPPANQSVNVAQVAGTATSVNSGTVDAGTQRNVLATNVGLPIGAATIGQSSGNGSMAANDTAGVARVFAEAPFGWDGTNNKQVTTSSLANEAPSSGAFTIPTGLQMVEKGPRWAISNVSAGGSQGTVSIAAAAAKRHVVDCIGFSADSSAAVTASNVTLNVRDGATGAGTAIWSYAISMPTAAALGVQEVPIQNFCGLNLIGTTNTAMTIEFSAAVTGSIQAVNMSGYDIN